MEAALQVCPDKDVVLDGQGPLVTWYATFGFEVTGPEFLDDGSRTRRCVGLSARTASVGAVNSPEQIGVVELRQYTLQPGRRDELIELFDRELVETQEACGMQLLGQFRDEDRPDHFVWLRGFADMETRRQALTSFFSGPVWAMHARAAVATMIDSDDVYLLEPVRLPELEPGPRVSATRSRCGSRSCRSESTTARPSSCSAP